MILILGAIGIAITGGVGGGIVFSLMRPILGKLGPVVGDYLAGLLAALACLITIGVILLILPVEMVILTGDLIPFAGPVGAAGLIGAFVWRRYYRAPS